MRKLFLAVILSLVLTGSACAFSVSDNSLLDFGVTPGTDWTPDDPDTQYTGLHVGTSPGVGGSGYDVLAMYAAEDKSTHTGYLAIVTGFPQSGRYDSTAPGNSMSTKYFYPGDIAIDVGKNGYYDFGIKTGNNIGYALNDGSGQTSGGINGTPGQVYAVSDWGTAYEGTGYKGVWGGISDPTVIQAGTLIGTAGFSYYTLGNYNVIEASLPLNNTGFSQAIDWTQEVRLHWTMTCGNDYLTLDLPAADTAPEPASLSLLGLGLLGLLGLKKKNAKS